MEASKGRKTGGKVMVKLVASVPNLDEAGRQEVARLLASTLEGREAFKDLAQQLWDVRDTIDDLAEQLAAEWKRQGTNKRP
jgi:hypothetical protein